MESKLQGYLTFNSTSKMLKFSLNFAHCIYQPSAQVSEATPEYLGDCKNNSWLMKKRRNTEYKPKPPNQDCLKKIRVVKSPGLKYEKNI